MIATTLDDELVALRRELEAERAAHLRTQRANELSANELQHANAELQAIFSSLPDLFLRIDARGMVVDHKGGAAHAFDHLIDPDPWNVPLSACVVQPAAAALEKALAQLSESDDEHSPSVEPGVERAPSYARIEYVLDGRGSARYFEARAVALPNRDKLVVITDISERMRAHHALMREQEDRADELRAFALAASHDLSVPVRNIDVISQWLEEDIDDPETTRGHVASLRRRVAYLDRLLGGMLEYVRAGAQCVAKDESVDLEALTREVCDLVVPSDFELTTSGLPRLMTGRVPLERVLQNLVANAVKYHDAPPGRIAITCQDAGDFVEISVCDDGPGIPEKDHERAFTLFRRLTHERKEGAGVGLALVRRIAVRVGGAVRLEPNPPRGLRAVVTWPKHWPKVALTGRPGEI